MLAQLDDEVHLIYLHMAQVVTDTNYLEEFITFRTRNLQRAIGRARERGGGAYIG